MNMTYTINRNGTDERLPFGAPFRDAVGVLHPWSVIAAWTDEELAAIGVTKVAVPVVEPEPLTLEQRKAMMVEAVNDRQWKVEIGGTVVAGIPIRTDEGSQNKMSLPCSAPPASGQNDTGFWTEYFFAWRQSVPSSSVGLTPQPRSARPK